VLRWLALGLLAAWFVGAVLFVRSDGSITLQLPRREQPPAHEHNVALYSFGPTLRASSYYREPSSHHHPAFLVDGRTQPSDVEKWASHWSDKRPWTELRWREPRTLSRVVIAHAGTVEIADYTAKKYRISCLTDGDGPRPEPVMVAGNEQPIATHPLACKDARGIRIDWTRARKKHAIVRVYEIEVWGR
jgi:hypothetical protein